MVGVLLYLISYFIELPVLIINFFTVIFLKAKSNGFLKTINGFFLNGAITRDKFANYNYRTGLNFWLLKKTDNKYLFGNPNETISSVLGKNQILKSLTLIGWFLIYFLWLIDIPNWKKGGHCIASIDNLIKIKS